MKQHKFIDKSIKDLSGVNRRELQKIRAAIAGLLKVNNVMSLML